MRSNPRRKKKLNLGVPLLALLVLLLCLANACGTAWTETKNARA